MNADLPIGDFIDRLSILELKILNVEDEVKLDNIQREFYHLNPSLAPLFDQHGSELQALYLKISQINGQIWVINEDLRNLLNTNKLNKTFVELSKKLINLNDERWVIKKDINLMTGSTFLEEKSYINF